VRPLKSGNFRNLKILKQPWNWLMRSCRVFFVGAFFCHLVTRVQTAQLSCLTFKQIKLWKENRPSQLTLQHHSDLLSYWSTNVLDHHQKTYPLLLSLLPAAYSCPPTSPRLWYGYQHMWSQEVNQSEKAGWVLLNPHTSPPASHRSDHVPTSFPHMLRLALGKGRCRGQAGTWATEPCLG